MINIIKNYLNIISWFWYVIIEFVFIIDFEILFYERVVMCEDIVDFIVGFFLINYLVLMLLVFKVVISFLKGFIYVFVLILIRYLWNLIFINCYYVMWKRKLII